MKKLIILLLLFSLTGCEKMNKENGLYVFIEEQNIDPISLVENTNIDKLVTLKERLLTLEEVQEVAIIEGQEEILVTYKVKQLSRFRMKHVEKEVKDVAEKFLQENKEIIVSSDYKIFLEAIRLHYQLLEKASIEEASEKLEWILKLKKEMT